MPSNLGMLAATSSGLGREFWGILEDNRNPRMAGTPAIGAIERVAGGCQLTSARADMLKSKRISLDLFCFFRRDDHSCSLFKYPTLPLMNLTIHHQHLFCSSQPDLCCCSFFSCVLLLKHKNIMHQPPKTDASLSTIPWQGLQWELAQSLLTKPTDASGGGGSWRRSPMAT